MGGQRLSLKFWMEFVGFMAVIVCLLGIWYARSQLTIRRNGFHLLKNYGW
jgi:hypothetical protein